MPPKSKQGKIEWLQCSLCNCFFLSKDSSKHVNICSSDKPFDTGNFVCTASSHSYVTDDILIALSQNHPSGNLTDIPKKLRETIALLNPQTLKLLGLSVGEYAVVQHTYAVRVWPEISIPSDSVALPACLREELSLCDKKWVIFYELRGPALLAASIKLFTQCSEDFVHKKQFFGHLKQVLDGVLITSGYVVRTSFYGQACDLIVSTIRGENQEETTIQNNAQYLLTDYCDIVNVDDDMSHINYLTDKMLNLKIALHQNDKKSDKSCEANLLHQKFPVKRSDVQFYICNKTTNIEVYMKSDCPKTVKKDMSETTVTLKNVGGYLSQIQIIREMMTITFSNPISNKFDGHLTPSGVLLYGPSGCGKSLITRALINTYSVHTVFVNGPEIWSKYFGESEAKIRSLFQEGKKHSPSIIFMDELDALCPKRESSHNDVEKRVVASLLTLVDDVLSGDSKVFIIAATNKRDNIDAALRRPGRLDREIEIGVPTVKERTEILEVLLQDTKHELTKEDIADIASNSHGYVGADLVALCKEAGLHAAKNWTSEKLSALCLTKADLTNGLQCVQPSAMREVAIEVPNVKWEDIGGQSELKHKLKQAIEWPLKHPEAFLRLGIRPPKGLLMYGPPGCSKTMIAKALAKEGGINFIAIKGPELFSKWVGESERAVREVFRKARSAAPAIAFFDEIDALAGERGSSGGTGGGEVSDRVLAQLLTEIDGVEALQDVTIVAATNRPDRIDKALLRPGRLDRIVYVPLPDDDTRREIFQIQFRKMPIASDVNLDELVQRTEKYSGAEVAAVCHEAALSAMQEDINIAKVHARHFAAALSVVTPRITQELVQFYDNYAGISGLHSV